MRKAVLAATVLAVMTLGSVALAESEYGFHNYKDKFDSGGYSGNDGSLEWSGPWKEVGESDGPESGAVRVEGSGCSGQCLVIDSGLLGVAAGAYRFADTAEFSDAKLLYTLDFDGGLLGLGNVSFTVEATRNGGASWSTVDSVALGSGGGAQSRSVDVTGFRAEDFGIRFTAIGAAGSKVLIDDVKVSGEIPVPTTTTTTTTSTTTSTTTTTLPKLTTTTLPKLTTTTLPDLTTTLPLLTTSSTTTTTPTTTTTTASGDDGSDDTPPTTTTAIPAGGGPDDPGGGNGGGDDGSGEDSGRDEGASGLRRTSIGVGGNFDSGLFGSTQPEVLGFEIVPGFSDAVELIEASWIWVLALALLIAGALIKGIDRRVSTPVSAGQTGG